MKLPAVRIGGSEGDQKSEMFKKEEVEMMAYREFWYCLK